MFRSLSTAVLLLLLALPGVALAQNTGKLSGRVTDAITGEPLIGANVFLADLQRGASTNVDGAYDILGLTVGQFDVRVSYSGYETQTISGVEISSGRTRTLDVQLRSTSLGEVIVEYERPLIQRDAIGVPKVLTGADIANLPVRGVQNVAAIQGGVVSNDGSNTLNIRGGRGAEVDYYIDGVKVIGSAAVPQAAIAEQEMLIGTIPPQYGDASAGVISISTRTGGNNFFGALEAVTSQGLDSYGYNLGALSLGGPLVRDRASFFASVQGIYQADASPYGISTLRLRDDIYNRLQDSPQVIGVRRDGLPAGFTFGQAPLFEDANFFYVSFPSGFDPRSTGFVPNADGTPSRVPRGITADSLARALGIPVSALSTQPVSAFDLIDNGDFFETRRGKDDPGSQLTASGNVEVRPISGISLRLGGAYTGNRDRNFAFSRSLFDRENFTTTEDRIGRGFVTLRQILSNTAFYQIQAEFSDRFSQTYPDQFGSDINQLINYGRLDAEGVDGARPNEVAGRYYNFIDGRYVLASSDGGIQSPRGFGNTFLGPGVPLSGYSKFEQQQFRTTASAQTQIGVHELSFGGEFESRTTRSFSAGAGFSRSLARDRIVRDSTGTIVRDAAGNPQTRTYAELPFSAGNGFNNPRGNVRYYGYNYLGLERADSDNLGDFLSGDNRNVAPHNPLYYGGYVRNRIEFEDLVLDLGLRLDVFDNNTRQLVDPFALVDIYRVDDILAGTGPAGLALPGGAPAGIDGNFAVYSRGTTITGFRDLEGRFFNASGEQLAGIGDLVGSQPTQIPGPDRLTERSFRDYTPQVTLMPRIGVTFPVTDRALFFASYNVTSQRPSENAFASIQDFNHASQSSGTINNPGLKPEVTTQYELGFRQAVGERASVTLSGFYRTQRNKVALRNFNQAFPSGYTTYTNLDFSTTKGVETGFELRRTRNLAVNANYTLQFAEGTGSDSNTANLLSFRTTNDIFPETLAPLAFDQRHNVNVSLDYRLGAGEGPMIAGVQPFAGFGLNLLGSFKSGNRYTQLQESARSSIYSSDIGLNVVGGVNEVTTPSTTRLDLRLDRRFNLGRANLQGYLNVENLLDSRNVISVYRTTGLPNDDGFLDSGSDILNNPPTALQQSSFRYLYSQFVGGPVDPGGFKLSGDRIYSLPRRIRLGVALDF